MPADDAMPKWSIRTWIELGGAIVAFALFVGSFGIAQYQIGELQKSYAVLEEARRLDHDTLVRMENDVRWIRQTLERQAK